MESSTYTDAKVIAASKSWVNVIAHSEMKHSTRDVILNGKKVTWCSEYWGIECSVHQEGAKGVGKYVQGSYGAPMTILIDPDGKELWRSKGGAMGSGELIKQMNEILAKVPGDHVSAVDWTAAKKSLAEADEAMGKEDYKKAIESAQKVAKSKVKTIAALAEEPLKKITEKGDALFEEAKGKIESDKAEAKKLLKKIAEQFKGMDVAKKAADALKEIKD